MPRGIQRPMWLASLFAVSFMPFAAAGVQGGQFNPLFDGTLEGWSALNTDAGNFRLSEEGYLHVEGPSGWLRADGQYGDFRLRAEFRFLTDDADSGFFVRTIGDSEFIRGWPNNGYQIQIRNPVAPSRFPPVGGLFRHGAPDGELSFDAAAVERAVLPTGEWQVLEIEAAGDRLRVWLNGELTTEAGAIGNSPGYIGLQGELGALEFRSIGIQPLD